MQGSYLIMGRIYGVNMARKVSQAIFGGQIVDLSPDIGPDDLLIPDNCADCLVGAPCFVAAFYDDGKWSFQKGVAVSETPLENQNPEICGPEEIESILLGAKIVWQTKFTQGDLCEILRNHQDALLDRHDLLADREMLAELADRIEGNRAYDGLDQEAMDEFSRMMNDEEDSQKYRDNLAANRMALQFRVLGENGGAICFLDGSVAEADSGCRIKGLRHWEIGKFDVEEWEKTYNEPIAGKIIDCRDIGVRGQNGFLPPDGEWREKFNSQRFEVYSSNGELVADMLGNVRQYNGDWPDMEPQYVPVRFDVAEWRGEYPDEKLEGMSVDTLDLGFVNRLGQYSPPDREWRAEFRESRKEEDKKRPRPKVW